MIRTKKQLEELIKQGNIDLFEDDEETSISNKLLKELLETVKELEQSELYLDFYKDLTDKYRELTDKIIRKNKE